MKAICNEHKYTVFYSVHGELRLCFFTRKNYVICDEIDAGFVLYQLSLFLRNLGWIWVEIWVDLAVLCKDVFRDLWGAVNFNILQLQFLLNFSPTNKETHTLRQGGSTFAISSSLDTNPRMHGMKNESVFGFLAPCCSPMLKLPLTLSWWTWVWKQKERWRDREGIHSSCC